jgi:hypothetical protein
MINLSGECRGDDHGIDLLKAKRILKRFEGDERLQERLA